MTAYEMIDGNPFQPVLNAVFWDWVMTKPGSDREEFLSRMIAYLAALAFPDVEEKVKFLLLLES